MQKNLILLWIFKNLVGGEKLLILLIVAINFGKTVKILHWFLSKFFGNFGFGVIGDFFPPTLKLFDKGGYNQN